MTRSSDYIVGWKDIAAFLGVSVRTAQRWETTAALPVRRIGPVGGTVQALRHELERWRELPPAAHAAALPPGPSAPAVRAASTARSSGVASMYRRALAALRTGAHSSLMLWFVRPGV